MPSKKIPVSKKHIFANRTTSTQWNFIVVAFHFWKVKVSFMSSFSVNIISVDFWEQIWSRPLNLSRNLERFASRNYFNCVLHHQIYVMSSGQLSFQKVEHTVHTHTDDHFEKHSLPSRQLQKTCMNASKRRSIALQKEYSTYSLQISSIP